MNEPVYDDIGAVELRKLLGGVSKAWLQRRLDPRHPEYDPTFPAPVQYTDNGRRYWSRGEIVAWRESKRRAATERREARLRGAAKEYVGRIPDDG
jgi:predicted DNA-binding transcriptional regulator AlpA